MILDVIFIIFIIDGIKKKIIVLSKKFVFILIYDLGIILNCNNRKKSISFMILFVRGIWSNFWIFVFIKVISMIRVSWSINLMINFVFFINNIFF